MRLPKLRLPFTGGGPLDGKPQFIGNAIVPNPKAKLGGDDGEQVINEPLWPDDDYRAHPMSPQPTRVSPIAIRVLASLSGISPFGPRAVRVTRNGAVTVAPERGSKLNSKEGNLDAVAGATTGLINPPATTVFIANDDPANKITFQIADKPVGNPQSPDYSTASTQSIPGGAQPVALAVTAFGINLPATGNTSAYRLWWVY